MTNSNPFAVLALDVDRPFQQMLCRPDGFMPLLADAGLDATNIATAKQAFVSVISSDSKVAAAARSEAPVWLAALREAKLAPDGMTDNQLVTLYVSSRCVTSWFMVTLDGRVIMEEDGVTPIACTPENVLKLLLLGEVAAWLIRQITQPIYARENFTPAPSTN